MISFRILDNKTGDVFEVRRVSFGYIPTVIKSGDDKFSAIDEKFNTFTGPYFVAGCATKDFTTARIRLIDYIKMTT